MAKEPSGKQIQYQKLHLSVRYNTVLFPFDVTRFVQVLPESGYVVRDELVGPVPFGARVRVTGSVAHKGEIVLAINMDRNSVGIDAIDVDTLVSEMDALEDLLLDRLGFDSQKSAFFYELLAEAEVSTDRSPAEVLGSKFIQQGIFRSLSTAIGEPTTNFGFRLVPTNANPNQPEWHDIRIQPDVARATTHYYLATVFRSAERSKVMDFASRLTGILSDALTELEEE